MSDNNSHFMEWVKLELLLRSQEEVIRGDPGEEEEDKRSLERISHERQMLIARIKYHYNKEPTMQ